MGKAACAPNPLAVVGHDRRENEGRKDLGTVSSLKLYGSLLSGLTAIRVKALPVTTPLRVHVFAGEGFASHPSFQGSRLCR